MSGCFFGWTILLKCTILCLWWGLNLGISSISSSVQQSTLPLSQYSWKKYFKKVNFEKSLQMTTIAWKIAQHAEIKVCAFINSTTVYFENRYYFTVQCKQLKLTVKFTKFIEWDQFKTRQLQHEQLIFFKFLIYALFCTFNTAWRQISEW